MIKELQIAKRFFIDFGIILLFCIIFRVSKWYYFSDISPPSWHSPFNAAWIVGTWSALTCYPAFLIGFRIKKSPLWFFALSWLTVFILFLLSLYLSQNLSYKIGDTYVFEDGRITDFGVVYKLSSPHSVMALISSALIVRHYFTKRRAK